MFEAVITVLIGINAYFARQTLSTLTDVKIELARLIVKHDSTDERSRRNNDDLNLVRLEQGKIREKLHTIEGRDSTMLQYIETTESEMKDIKKRLEMLNSK